MRFNNILKTLIGLCLLIFCTFTKAEPMLNGIGTHQELGKDLFIGALFSESLSNNADTLLNNSQAMRIELKIVAADGFTTRRFSNMWIEGMAINNKVDVLTAQADNMVKFSGLFKGRFQTGDHIVFTSTPTKGVDISVNGVVLGNIADYTFFSMLLTTWIGKVPLSSDYRDSLLKVGDVDAGLRARYDAIKPSVARVAEINGWKTGVAATTVADAKSKADEKKAAELAAAGLKDAAQTATKPTMPDLAVGIEKPTLDIPKLDAEEQPATTATVADTKPVAATPTTAPTPAEEEEEAAPVLTAQSLVARQVYISGNLKKIFSKTRYPGNALQKGHAGSVRVAVIIDRQGNIVSTKTLEESKYSALNKEAVNAIKRAAPYPAVPDAVVGNTFEFTVPIRFTLPKQPAKK